MSLLFFTSVTFGANDSAYDKGFVAYQSGEYEKAIEFFTDAANKGNAKAQVKLGVMYWHGQGVTQDYNQAFELFTLAAEQGNARAINALGMSYEQGKGVTQDISKAVKWYTLAAEQGLIQAKNNLGLLNKKGLIANHDDKQTGNPITILGINWSLGSRYEIKIALEDKGFQCKEGFLQYNCSKDNMFSSINIDNLQVTIPCEYFSGCKYSLKEVANSILEQGIVKRLDFETEKTLNYAMTNWIYISKYCGRGDEGDSLCILENPIRIQLKKDNFGQGGMKFN